MKSSEQYLDLARDVMRQEAEAVLAVADGADSALSDCARVLSECPGIIWVTGVGTSAAVGRRFAHILTDCGVRSMFLSPEQGLHGHTGVMRSDEVLVALSRGGESEEVNQMVRTASGRGVVAVAFVHDTESTLAQLGDYVLPIRSSQELELMGYVATTSTVAFSAVCDAVCAIVLEHTGYTPKDLRKTHPGGAVGQALHAGTSEQGGKT